MATKRVIRVKYLIGLLWPHRRNVYVHSLHTCLPCVC